MPLTRYQIRNEYGLADPELYKAAERDDPEALLEGVAMAGLVGVLRQLGDLAEFAAEIFHDLHEEVMTTAARGHGLMARVQQLEADFPSIEKAFLSQTSHLRFFSAPGVDWHPNLRSEQNLVTRGDLPRFVMDSYEECRGPPRLFLLDKFDIAGAGACLKRYTDPSFFKAEAKTLEVPTGDVQREKKIRKVKKKGARMRNGETSEIAPSPHAKLHQLLQEERIDNGSHNPLRAVKLKKRQLNGYPFDSETGKGYMVKFVDTPSPEHRVVCEVPANLPRLKFRSDHNSETAVKVLEINTASPVRKSLQRDDRSCSPPYAPEVLYKPSIYELKEEIINKASEDVPELSSDGETDETPSSLPEEMDKRKFADDGDSEGGREGSVDGYLSDDVTSEVDNYMDALTTMESEIETDNENKAKNGLAVLNLEKHGMDSDVYKEQLELQAHFSDSQSIGNCSASDDGNSSSKKGRSSFAYSDSPSNLAENTPSDGDGTDKVSPSNENCIDEFTETPPNTFSTSAEIFESKSDDLEVPNDTSYIEEVENPDTRETYCGLGKFVEKPSDCSQFSTISSDADETKTNLADSRAVLSSTPSLNGDHTLFAVPDKTHAVDRLDGGGLDDIADAPLNLSNVSEGASEQKGSVSGNEMPQANNHCTKNFDSASGEVGTSHSVSPANEQLLCSALPQVEVFSANLENLAPLVDVPQIHSCPEQRFSAIPDDTLQLETDPDEISEMVDGQETGRHRCNVDGAGREAVPLQLPCNYPNVHHEDCVNLDDMITDTIQAEDVALSAASADSTDNGVNGVISSYSDIMFSPRDLVSSHESFSDPGYQQQKGLKFKEAISPEYIVDAEAQEEVNQIEVASTDSDSAPQKSVSFDGSSVETLNDVQDVSLVEQDQYSLHVGDAITTSIPSQLRNEESEPTSPQPDNLSENSEDALPSSTCLQETGVSVQQISRLEDDQVHIENLQVDKEQIQSPTYKDEKLCFDVSKSSPQDLNQAPSSEFSQQSAIQEIDVAGKAIDLSDPVLPCHGLSAVTPGNHDSPASRPEDLTLLSEFVPQSSIQEADGANQATGPIDSSLPNFGLHSVATEVNHSAESCSDNLPRQLSSSAFLLQPAGQDNQVTKQAMDQIDSGLPFFGIFPVATQEQPEMPPLPPLPPMQWRMGKVHNAPFPSLRDSIQLSQDSHTSVLSSAANDEVQFVFTTPERETLQPQNPFMPHIVLEDERSQHHFERLDGNSAQLTSYSSQTPNMVNDLAGEDRQSLNSFLTFPTISHDRAAHGALTSGEELIQSSSNPFPSVSADEDATSRYDLVSSQGNQMQPLNQLATETAGNATTFHYISKDLQGQGDTSCNTSAPPQSVADEQPQNGLLTSGGEIAWYSNTSAFVPFYEIPKPNGKSTVKLPRPRSPLIDAVAAHDKSTLRKVTERVRPEIEPKVDERDLLLEQIRTKSFCLKPAVVTRPSIQGPKTNLKVAAILEKANAIRQALAGSDDDDDDADSWSDS